MKLRLNDRRVAELKRKAKRYEVRDEIVPGLVLRVGAKGHKVWMVILQDGIGSNGRPRRKRMRLGVFPDMTVKDARHSAEAAKDELRHTETSRSVSTVGELFDKYAEFKAPQRRAWRDVQSAWEQWAKPTVGHVALTDVSALHGLALRDRVARDCSQNRAAMVLRYLRPMFAWAADERYLAANPWAGLRVGAQPSARDRVLSRDEWSSLWEAAADEAKPFKGLVRALMLSAQRLSNVAQMRWDEVHQDVWIIPATKFKATRPGKERAHEVPLSKALVKTIAEQDRLGDWVFMARPTGPINPGSRLKKRLSGRMGFDDWRFHDIRRTAATFMRETGADRFTVERVLGHADHSVTAVYDRSTHRAEKREALDELSATLPDSYK